MSGLGGIFHWDGAPVPTELPSLMMEAVRHRGPDGLCCETDGPAGLGHALLALRRIELEQQQPVWLPDRSAAVVADCRIDNRAELRRALGDVSWLRRDPSDAELILAAYERWDTGLPDRLLGDFAFAVWDAARRRVVAARDPFGVRPLFFHWTPTRLAIASEPRQILALPGVGGALDELVVGEFLFGKFEDLDRTFFRAVRRLRPAHLLVATGAGVETRRYWRPDPAVEARFGDRREYLERFHVLLKESVWARIDSDYAVAAQLSGGLDSSSVVVVAAGLLDSAADRPPSFSVLSGIFPGLPCDESPFIRAVAERVPFDVHTFEPAREPLIEGLVDELAAVNSPFIDLQRGSWTCQRRILRPTSSRTLLTGLGGDELLHEQYYLRDLALRGRFATLVSEARRASHYSWNSFGWLLADALKPLEPDWATKLRRRWLRRWGWRAPRWAEPGFVRFFEGCPEVPLEADPGFPSLVQKWAYRWLTCAPVCWALESLETHASAAAVSATHPFLDRRLAEYVLSIPLEARLPRGRWKVLVREGLASELPALVRDRTRKTPFAALHTDIMRRHGRALFRELFADSEWRASRYVDREGVRKDLESLLHAAEIDAVEVDALWRAATLELWLRQLRE